jgi:twinfilin-like protein
MSHSSGISVSSGLLERFAAARTSGDVRWIKAVIREESVEYVTDHPNSGDLEKDFRSFASVLEPKEPCYILFRLEDAASSSSTNVQRWLFVTYAPDVAKVKEKMLIASTRDNAKKQLGYNYFSTELYGAKKEELTYEEFEASIAAKHSDAPLTAAEVHLKSEVNLVIDHGTTREYVHSVQFPVDKQALAEVENLKKGSKNFVLLQVDPNKETIDFVKSGTISAPELVKQVPGDRPSFALYQWNHKHEGATERSILFIYCCPMTSQVKLKMLFSTVNKAAISAIEGAGLKITNKVEVDSPEDLTEDELMLQVHPKDDKPTLGGNAQKFSRPMRPGRGRARMTKN